MAKLSLRFITTIIVRLLIFGVIGLFLFPIFRTSRMHWPEITDYNILFSEAQAMSQQEKAGFISEADCPASIQQLSPRFVRVDTNFVEIVISTGGISSAWGFRICTGSMPDLQRIQGLKFTSTEHPKIYRWVTIE